MSYGKSIELFLVNGSADSLITAELSNWNGKAIKIPRIEVASCNREDITQAGVEADGIRTSEGFVVLQGSRIAVEDDDTIPTVLKEQRRKVSIVEGVLQEDVLFSSPSYAAMFVIGKSANGLTSWKDEDGHSLKEIENSETREENK